MSGFGRVHIRYEGRVVDAFFQVCRYVFKTSWLLQCSVGLVGRPLRSSDWGQSCWKHGGYSQHTPQHLTETSTTDTVLLTVCVCVSANSTWKPRHHRGVDPLDTRLDGQLVPPIRRQLVSLSSGFVGWASGRRGTVVADQRRGGEPRPTPDQSEPGTVVLLCSAFRSYFCFSFSFIHSWKKNLPGFHHCVSVK